ncbi:hypothetical protein TGVAND_260490 [Toxoplasma gondii VAND]|uniref:Uncharacterized protein n=2 Tax=Toxoplasma gondii TaxID=5811 RepID=A0A086K696_TOXGO|nr:hypothetical protein TGP89_260490 [Toxoplasma gondii p89]KFH10695.1 hypothetical protein TGVAND_260490 [Toxoplasma gondii VAND]
MSASVDIVNGNRTYAPPHGEEGNRQTARSYPGAPVTDSCGHEHAAKRTSSSLANTPVTCVNEVLPQVSQEDEQLTLPLALSQTIDCLAEVPGEPALAADASPSQHACGEMAREEKLDNLETSGDNCVRRVGDNGEVCLKACCQEGEGSIGMSFAGSDRDPDESARASAPACCGRRWNKAPNEMRTHEGCGLSLYIRSTGGRRDQSAARMDAASCREEPSRCEHAANGGDASNLNHPQEPPFSSLHLSHLQDPVFESGRSCPPLATVDGSLKFDRVRLDPGLRTLLEDSGEGFDDDEIVESSAMKRGNSWPYFWVRRHLLLERRSLLYFSFPPSPCAPPRGFLPLHAHTRVLVLPERISLYGRTNAYLLAVFNPSPSTALLPPIPSSKASLLSTLVAFLPTAAAALSVVGSNVSPSPCRAPSFLSGTSSFSLPPQWRLHRGHRTKHPKSPSFRRLSTSSGARSPSVAPVPWSPINPILAIKMPTLSASQLPLLSSASNTGASSDCSLDVSLRSPPDTRTHAVSSLSPPVVICSPDSFSATFDNAEQPKFLFDFGDPGTYCRFCRSLALTIRRVQRQADAKNTVNLSQRLSQGAGASPCHWESDSPGRSKAPSQSKNASSSCSSCLHLSERVSGEAVPSRRDEEPENATHIHNRLSYVAAPPGVCRSPVFYPSRCPSTHKRTPATAATVRAGSSEFQSSPGLYSLSESPSWNRDEATHPAACRTRFLEPASCATDLDSRPCLAILPRWDTVPLGGTPAHHCRCQVCMYSDSKPEEGCQRPQAPCLSSSSCCPRELDACRARGCFLGPQGPPDGEPISLSNTREVLSRFNSGFSAGSSRVPVEKGEFFPESTSPCTWGYAESEQLEPRADVVEALSSLLDCLKSKKRREQRELRGRPVRQEGRGQGGYFPLHSAEGGVLCAAHQNRVFEQGQVAMTPQPFVPAAGPVMPVSPSQEPQFCGCLPSRDEFVEPVGDSTHLASGGDAEPLRREVVRGSDGDCRCCKSEEIVDRGGDEIHGGTGSEQRSQTESTETIRSLSHTMNKLLHALEEFSPHASPQWIGEKSSKRELSQRPGGTFPSNNTTTTSPSREGKAQRVFGAALCPTDPWFRSCRESDGGHSLNIADQTTSEYGSYGSSRPSTSRPRDAGRMSSFGKENKGIHNEENCQGLHTVSPDTTEPYFGGDETTRAFSASRGEFDIDGTAEDGTSAAKDLLLVQQQDQLERLQSVVDFLLRQQELQLAEGRQKDEAALREEWEEQQRQWEVERRLRLHASPCHMDGGRKSLGTPGCPAPQNAQLPAADTLTCYESAGEKFDGIAKPGNSMGLQGGGAVCFAVENGLSPSAYTAQGGGAEDTACCLAASSVPLRSPPCFPLSGGDHVASQEGTRGIMYEEKDRSPSCEGETMVESYVSPVIRASQMTENEEILSAEKSVLHERISSQPDVGPPNFPEKRVEQPLFFSISTPRFRLDTCDDDEDLPQTTPTGYRVHYSLGARGCKEGRACCTSDQGRHDPVSPASAVKRPDFNLGLAPALAALPGTSIHQPGEETDYVEETVQMHDKGPKVGQVKDNHESHCVWGEETSFEGTGKGFQEANETGSEEDVNSGRKDALMPAGDEKVKEIRNQLSFPSASAAHAWARLQVSIEQEEKRDCVHTTSDAGSGVSPTSAAERDGEVEIWSSFPSEKDVQKQHTKMSKKELVKT